MVVTFSASQSSGGLRHINPNKDFPQLVELLRVVFGQELKDDGQLFGNAQSSQNPAFLWRFDPQLARLSPGFVWEIDNRIIGNVTLLPSRPYGRFLVANVAVHHDYRRQGYARLLMNAAVQDVRDRHGREILLQVVHDNERAISLYRSMGFDCLGSMTTWQTSVSRIRDLPIGEQRIKVQPLHMRRWQEAYQLDCQALDPDLNWPEPQRADYYKTGLWRRFFGFMNANSAHTFVTLDNDSQLSGLTTVHSEWGRPHQITVRIHPSRQGQLELPLLNSAIKRVRNLARRNIRLIHNADDQAMNQLLPSANFGRQRTLTHMRLKLA